MTDTYNIDGVTNNKLGEWKNQGYQEQEGSTIKDELLQGTSLGREVDPSHVQKLRDNEDVLVKKRVDRVERENPQRQGLKEDLEQVMGQVSNVQGELRNVREERREEQEDLDGLEQQLEELEKRRDELLEEASNLRDEGNIEEAQQLEGQAGALQSNQIAELNRVIRTQRRTVEQLTEEVDQTRNNLQDLQDQAQGIKDRIDDLDPVREVNTVIEDVILICETEYETYISGSYIPPNSNSPTRTIEGRGPKTIVIGARAPLQERRDNNEENFWDDIYNQIRNEVFRNPGGFPDGEWINQLIDRLQDMGPAAQQGMFTGSNWNWTLGPATGSHEFPQQENFTDSTQNQCESFDEIPLTRQ